MIMTLRAQWKRSTTPPAVRPGQRDAMIEGDGPKAMARWILPRRLDRLVNYWASPTVRELEYSCIIIYTTCLFTIYLVVIMLIAYSVIINS